ncbi:hypothetical protein ACGF5S_21135 [Nocardia nova]|uniref:hypothetical protein n=1 Tax=Nocardia nova TaxID=37330 RepID=UPI00371E3376
MKMSLKLATAAAITVAALSVVASPAKAAPIPAHVVSFQVTSAGPTAIVTTDSGSLGVDNGVFTVRADDGTALAGAELSFRVDDFTFPIAVEVAGSSAKMIPQFDLAHAVYTPVDLPYQDSAPWKTPYDREQAAWNRLTSTISAGATAGALVGGLAGGAVGCVLGGIAGATVAAATIVGMFGPFVPAAVVGCLGGIIAVGALGTLAGQLLVTAPVAILAVAQYFTTINQPFVAPPK